MQPIILKQSQEFNALKNNLNRVISEKRALEIAGQWHGGQWSALYSFASSGEMFTQFSLEYINECVNNIQSEYHTSKSVYQSEKDKRELKSLIRFFLKFLQDAVNIEFVIHPNYGYTFPQLSQNNDLEVFELVNGLKLPV